MDAARLAEITQKVEALQVQFSTRDNFAIQVRAVRNGDFDQIAPGIFPEEWPRPVTANIVDNMARDFAAKLSPLPAFTCSAASSLSDTARKFADKRTKIANHYVKASKLKAQMPDAADNYNSYGMVVFSVEPDMECGHPMIRVEDSTTVYPVWDRNMKTTAAAKIFFLYKSQLIAQYPHVEPILKAKPGALYDGEKVRVIKWVDKKECLTYLPDLGNEVLETYANPLDDCTFVCVPRPSGMGTWGNYIKGQYDDLIWPQVARNEFQILALEAADKAVRAPIVVPPDVTDVTFGPDAVMQTQNPQGVSRLKVDVPPASFQAMEWLRQDMQLGGMSAQGQNVQASVITGAGIDALNEGYSTQLAQAQEMMSFALEQVIDLCFDIDEKVWPNKKKTIRGEDAGVPYEVTYTPSKDIAGDHSIDIQYGFLAGLDANRSLIFILQAFGAGLISQDYAMRNLPAHFNISEETKKIELERVRKAILEGAMASAQAIPQMAMAGGDPTQLMTQLSNLAEALKKGEAVETAALKAFAPPPPPPPAPEQVAPGASPSAPGAASLPPAGSQQGGGGAPPQQPGQRPGLMQMMAGITNGGASNLQANVLRQTPTVA